MIEQLAEYPSPGTTSRSNSEFGSKGGTHPLMRAGDVRELVEPVEQLILKYPAAALATAFVVGVVVAWWIKRK